VTVPYTPGYWMHETGGELRGAVERYLNSFEMTDEDIALMRAYLRQWMQGPWRGAAVPELRRSIDEIKDRDTLAHWLDRALDAGVDPL